VICLKCRQDNLHAGPNCNQCGNWIGFVNDGRGFIPQLEYLHTDLVEQRLTAAEAGERLQLLEGILDDMVQTLDARCHQMSQIGLNETQMGVLAAFVGQSRTGLEQFVEVVARLEEPGEWPETIWAEFDAAQFEILKGNEGMAYLTTRLLEFATEKGQTAEEVLAQARA
jgi:hypothetical protein